MIATFWLATFLRLFHGWQGVILFFGILLAVSMFFGWLLSLLPFWITTRPDVQVHPEVLERRNVPLRPFSEPAAKGIERKRLDNLVRLGDRNVR